MAQLTRIFFLLLLRLMLVFVMALGSTMAAGQVQNTQTLRHAASLAQDLSYPEKFSEFGFFSTPSMAMYKPKGDGPFPALVLQHQCGGLRNASGSWQNLSMLEWARTAVKRGYVALVIDSLGPRGAGRRHPICGSGVVLPRLFHNSPADRPRL